MKKIAYISCFSEEEYKKLDMEWNLMKSWQYFYDYSDEKMMVRFISKYANLEDVDLFVFMNFYKSNVKWYKKIIDLKLEHKTVYYMAEPETVMKQNSVNGIRDILKFFHHIVTCDGALLGKDRCSSWEFPYVFEKPDIEKVEFQKKELLVNISANKTSKYSKELYSERRRIIDFCEEHYPNQFALYGARWENEGLHCYRGRCESKYKVYARFKFALCLENERKDNYITEKLFDCFVSGVVPIYAGANNITSIIPKECYVLYDEFSSISEIMTYLENMSEEEYNKYIVAAKGWLESEEKRRFEPAQKLQQLYELACKIETEPRFRVKKRDLIFYKCKIFIKKVLIKSRLIVKSIIDRRERNLK